MNRCPRLAVFSASAHIPAAVMLIGGVGWMAGPACVIPRQSVRLYEHLAACIKAGLQANGYAVGDPVPPQPALGPDERAIVVNTLADLEQQPQT